MLLARSILDLILESYEKLKMEAINLSFTNFKEAVPGSVQDSCREQRSQRPAEYQHPFQGLHF